ncbi:MAG TPA: nucleotide exchange factor GrpE [Bryobacteraceae bacterium]|nr:nucleotide exchange factor GrpE [Bryobacteraceae bacterium]HOL73753.1 nucleotide exchange factor GrpE [Bryobacteraceae bacterium]HOQ46064.1 nucleotide exchange factor GrpE [Bryobacteraceae bacterium]HPQ16246.1 nucleotide exchange factor GrpE [Bryobacteraceae bacterium]HPU72825.1 nucleotide exchange factor GrpE [Bryobacteraceae bacterium]
MNEEKFPDSTEAAPGSATGAETAETTESTETADVADSAALVAALTSERDQLARERADLYDQLLRRTAEFENFRKRTQRERTELFEFAAMDAVRELLPVLDDFEIALKVESADKDYAKGMELIYQRLLGTLQKIGLEPFDSQGKKFDPEMHHAVEVVPSEEAEENTVVQELKRGYNFKGRLLRPAMVKVAAKK